MQRYAITDRRLLPCPHEPGSLSEEQRRGLHRLVQGWVAAGVEFMQLREKDLPLPALLGLSRELAALTKGSRSCLFVSGVRPEVAVDAGASGVHLPAGWTAEEIARLRLAGMVSVACHAVAEVTMARRGGATLALLSPIFRTESHPDAPALGLETLAEGCRTAPDLPVFALGGVDAVTAPACLAAGAAGIAGIRMFLPETWA